MKKNKDKPARCTWVNHSNEVEDYWEGDCGVMWQLGEGKPGEHDCNYCPKCGRLIKIGPEPRN